eukprot:403340607
MQKTIQGLLSQYISNLEKTELSLWSGTLDLKNIILNDDAMEDLVGFCGYNLRLSSTFIDKIHIDIPIIDFLTKPMIIKANSLYATLNFLNDSQMDQLIKRQQEENKKQKEGKLEMMRAQALLQSSDQEETILNSMKNKLATNINIELKKAKFILFSDQGFDIVLKIRNVSIVNNKAYYHDEFDKEYDSCNSYIRIGQLNLLIYDNSLKKTNKFQIFEYKDLKLFNTNQLDQMFKKLFKFQETLTININQEVFKKLSLLWNLMTERTKINQQFMINIQNQNQGQRFETEIDFNSLQILIYDDKQYKVGRLLQRDQQIEGDKLLYLGDIQTFRLKIYNVAQIFKQQLQFGSVEFKYHSIEQDNFQILLQFITSDLFSIDIQSFHEKQDYSFKGDQVKVRLFRLLESYKFIKEIKQTLEDIKQRYESYRKQQLIETPDLQSQDISVSAQLTGKLQKRPKITIDVTNFEAELINEDNQQESKLMLQVNGLKGEEDTIQNRCIVQFGEISFKILEYYVVRNLELKLLFDDYSQVVIANRISVQIDLLKVKRLIEMNLTGDIDSFFKILQLMAGQNQVIEEKVELVIAMPQDNQVKQIGKEIAQNIQISCNTINVNIGYQQKDNFVDILLFEIYSPRVTISDHKIKMNLQMKAFIVERFSQYKLGFIDKLRVQLKEQTLTGTKIKMNNLRVNIFPETIRELQRLMNIYNSEILPKSFRYKFVNKTLKKITIIPNGQYFKNKLIISQPKLHDKI